MTLAELKKIDDILQWARGKALTDHIVNQIADCRWIIKREIKLKETDFIRMIDVNGNPINEGE